MPGNQPTITARMRVIDATEFVVDRLNDALAVELLCSIRADSEQRPAQGAAPSHGPDPDFREIVRTRRSLQRAHRIKARISALGGEVTLEPQALFAWNAPEWASLSGLERILSGFAQTGEAGDARLRSLIEVIGAVDVDSRRLLEGVAQDRAEDEREAIQRPSRTS